MRGMASSLKNVSFCFSLALSYYFVYTFLDFLFIVGFELIKHETWIDFSFYLQGIFERCMIFEMYVKY